MFASFLITFREALEAALIIGIMVAYLSKVGRRDLSRYLYAGTGLALAASLGLGAAFYLLYGGLEGKMAEVFEGVASLTAAGVLTYMIFWMSRNARKLKGEFQERMDVSISRGQTLGLGVLAFVAVFREGVETVLFLGTLAMRDLQNTLIGAAAGIAVVLSLATLLFRGIYRLNLKKFFSYTSVLLLVIAAGLTAYGVHEFNEAGIIPPVIEHVWDINPPQNPDGSYPALHEKGAVGSVLKSLVGYNGNPSLTEVIVYLGYWLVVGLYIVRSAVPRAASKPQEA